jgi:hypothetical protein
MISEGAGSLGCGLPRFPHLEDQEQRECDAVARRALDHIGKSYKITRELWPGLIDCSTLVSQSHWSGAAIQTPFIAETQRRASNAQVIESVDLLPGDAIYSYPSKEESPGGRHNHVALFLGGDQHGTPWVIESREEEGVILGRLDEVKFGGGIRRFCIEPLRRFPKGMWSQLVPRVPKLGRLGARLTASYTGTSRRHRGIDVYVEHDWPVVSPTNGMIVTCFKTSSSSGSFIGVWSSRHKLCSLVGPVEITTGLRVGQEVEAGRVIGSPASGAGPGGCNTIPRPPGTVRLHWELWASPGFGVSPASDLKCEWLPRGLDHGPALVAHNAIYALKRGDIGGCIAAIPGDA